jgi:dynein heavy chain
MKNGASPAKESIWQYFVTKCSINLHVVLCMSPTGDTLRTRCRNFPGKYKIFERKRKDLN